MLTQRSWGVPLIFPGSRAVVLLVATMTLVVFSTMALAAGFVWHARQPVTLSLVAIPLAVATLVFYTRTVRAVGSDDAWAPEAGPAVAAGVPCAHGTGSGVAVVESYDVLRVAEILPLLEHLDSDDLRVVQDYERSCRARRGILARVETLLELGDQSRRTGCRPHYLTQPAADIGARCCCRYVPAASDVDR